MMFRPKREELRGDWGKKKRNEELHGLYYPPNTFS
jgi:hypothetical protein